MITFFGMGVRYLELGVIGAAIVTTGLLFLRRRPYGLVWVSAPMMSVLAAHLFIEDGRWQLIPAYAIVFILSIWLAVPSRRAYRTGGLVIRIVIAVFVLIPALLLPLAVPLFIVPPPTGPYRVGVATIGVSAPDGHARSVVVRYPAADGRDGTVAPYWTRDEVMRDRIPGFPRLFSTHLSLVPTNSWLRAPRAPGVFPVAIAVVPNLSLPADFLMVSEQIASLGWIVLELPSGFTSDEAVRVLNALRTNSLDVAFDAAADTDRAVFLRLGSGATFDLGLPTIGIGGETLVSVVIGRASFGMTMPDIAIPDGAFTNRYLLTRPGQLIVGSSDVPPAELGDLIRRTVSALLSGGDGPAPIFARGRAETALAAMRMDISGVLPGLTVRPLSDSQ